MYYTNDMPISNLTNPVKFLAALILFTGSSTAVFAAQSTPLPSHAAVGPIEAVTDFTSTADLTRQGTLDVHEHITYDFGPAAPHTISHRILTGYTDDQGNLLQSKFVLLSSTQNDQPLTLQPDINGTVANINLPPGNGSGPRRYSLHYTLSPAVLAGPNADVFKYSVTGLGWAVPVNQASVVLNTPRLTPQSLTCYTGAGGSTTSSCRVTENGSTSSVVTDAVLAPGESLSLYTGFPRHSFTDYYNSWNVLSLWPFALGAIAIIGLLITIPLLLRRRHRHPDVPDPN